MIHKGIACIEKEIMAESKVISFILYTASLSSGIDTVIFSAKE